MSRVVANADGTVVAAGARGSRKTIAYALNHAAYQHEPRPGYQSQHPKLSSQSPPTAQHLKDPICAVYLTLLCIPCLNFKLLQAPNRGDR